MNLSHRALTSIKSKGFRAKPYTDPEGVLRIGYGHRVTPGDGVAPKDLINVFKGSELLEQDIKQIVKQLVEQVPSNITQQEFDKLVLQKYN